MSNINILTATTPFPRYLAMVANVINIAPNANTIAFEIKVAFFSLIPGWQGLINSWNITIAIALRVELMLLQTYNRKKIVSITSEQCIKSHNLNFDLNTHKKQIGFISWYRFSQKVLCKIYTTKVFWKKHCSFRCSRVRVLRFMCNYLNDPLNIEDRRSPGTPGRCPSNFII